jgi:tRNA threonylcarbamoyladenosine biosynthesis protein TsaB
MMQIVAIDTSGRNGSVALCRGDAASFEVLGMSDIEGGTYSARLMPCIADLLREAGLDKSHIDGFVVVDGPGSFTGLRVGLSTVKGLCEALDKPLAAVSMLGALAIVYGEAEESVTAVLDAGRGEIYVGEFKVTDREAEAREQTIMKLADFLAKLPTLQSRTITTFPKVTGAALVAQLKADAIARIGLRKLLAGETVDSATLDANYMRRSDAELYSLLKK